MTNDKPTKLVSTSPELTYDIGKSLAADLVAGDVVLLYGGLGAGKTLLTKGIMDGVGYDVDEVTSPSFALVNRYDTEWLTIFHVDLWRLDGALDIPAAVGLEELHEHENAILIIEWADRLGDRLPRGRTIKVTITGDGDEDRMIEVAGFAEPVATLAEI